ncbi:hypothetical protein ACFX13_047093 [Malus domestica]
MGRPDSSSFTSLTASRCCTFETSFFAVSTSTCNLIPLRKPTLICSVWSSKTPFVFPELQSILLAQIAPSSSPFLRSML